MTPNQIRHTLDRLDTVINLLHKRLPGGGLLVDTATLNDLVADSDSLRSFFQHFFQHHFGFSSNQSRIVAWVRKVFDEATATNAPERALRLVEEAIELAQVCGVDAAALHRLVDYVFNRPVGEPSQEIAGCMVTLYSAAHALGVDADEAFERELSRIQQPEVIDRVRRRQKEKREALVATMELPGGWRTRAPEPDRVPIDPMFDPVVRPIEELPGARPSPSGLEGPKRGSP